MILIFLDYYKKKSVVHVLIESNLLRHSLREKIKVILKINLQKKISKNL